MSISATPVAQLRRLRTELKQERETLGISADEVTQALEWSATKLTQIENGPVAISVTDLSALLFHYEITDKKRVDELVEMARVSKNPKWWHSYRDIYPQSFLDFLDLEESAVRIRQFHGQLIPGLLQSRDYARALLTAREKSQTKIESGLKVLLRRQALTSSNGPKLEFILDEVALHRVIGDQEIMRQQLLRLTELTGLPNISIRIVPFAVGAHASMATSFSIMNLSPEENDYALLLDQADQERLINKVSEETKRYVHTFLELKDSALSIVDTIALISELVGPLPVTSGCWGV